MNGCAAPECDLSLQPVACEEVAERTADDLVLFYLREIRPGRIGAPLAQVSDGDQESISTGVFITSFHLGFLWSATLKEAMIGLAAGSRSLKDFAFTAKDWSAFA